MKLLHTSDWHLGASDGDRSLLEDQTFFIDELCRLIREHGVDAVLLAGDIYDRSVPAAEAVRLYDHAMTRICGELGVPVLAIAGNHDSAERIASCAALLAPSGLHLAGSLTMEPVCTDLGDAEVFLIPWITEERVKSLYPEERENIHSMEYAFRAVTARLRERFTPGKRHIALAHAFVSGSETSTSDRAAEIGYATQVSAGVFDGFDYVALGHIHKPQDVTDTIRYSGTPMPYSFGREEAQVKSVTLLDTETMEREIVPLPLLHRRATLTGTLEELLHGDVEEDIRTGYTRLCVTDSYVGLEALARLREVYPCLLEVAGKSYEGDEGTVTLSIEELERLETSPSEVFRYFCGETMGEEPDEHLMQLFEAAVAAVTEGNE